MSGDLVLYAATYDSVSLVTLVSDYPRLLIGLTSGLEDSPEVRGGDSLIPGAVGMVPRNRVWHMQPIMLGGWVYGTGATDALQRADFRDAMEELRVLFDPTRDPAELVITREDGGTATITARPVNLVQGEVFAIAREVSIRLESVSGPWVHADP